MSKTRLEKRLELHTKLRSIIGSDNVYFQPPESMKIKYPAVIYEHDWIETLYADNKNYLTSDRYQVTFIDQDPDNAFNYISSMFNNFLMCSYERHFVNDNLNHDVFTIYY